MFVQGLGRADLFDGAFAQHHHPVGQVHRLFLIVGDEDGGDPGLVMHPAQPVAQLLAHLGVQGAERLVQQEHARLDGQGAGQGHALLLAAGQLGRIALAQALQLDQREQFLDPLGDLGLLRPLGGRADPQAEGDVVGHGHVAEQGVVLEHHAHPPLARGQGQEVLAVQADRAFVGSLEPGDRPQQGGLARARGAQQGQEFAGLGAQGDALQGREAAEALADPLDQQSLGRGGLSAQDGRARRRSAIRGGSWRGA